MDYNTQRTLLTLPEYGRNVQKMVDFLKLIIDREDRTKQAEVVVKTMLQMMAGYRDNEEFREKVWHHLYIMADYDLDVDCPYKITRENSKSVVLEKLEYNQKNTAITSYGRIIKELINEAIRFEGTDEERYPVVLSIANQMKKIYVLWHKDFAADSVIIDDIKRLSGGKLSLPDGTQLVNAKELIPKATTTRPPAKKVFKKKRPARPYTSNSGGSKMRFS
jgi:hypothetical protein